MRRTWVRLVVLNALLFVILLAAMAGLSRKDQRPADGTLTVGWPRTFYSDLQNEGCFGPPQEGDVGED